MSHPVELLDWSFHNQSRSCMECVNKNFDCLKEEKNLYYPYYCITQIDWLTINKNHNIKGSSFQFLKNLKV